MNSDSETESEYEYEEDPYFNFEPSAEEPYSHQDLYSVIYDEQTLTNLVEYHEELYQEKINRYWWILTKSFIARSHWRKYAYLWLGEKHKFGDNRGKRIVNKENLKRGTLAQEKYQKEIASPYRKLFIYNKFPSEISNLIIKIYLDE